MTHDPGSSISPMPVVYATSGADANPSDRSTLNRASELMRRAVNAFMAAECQKLGFTEQDDIALLNELKNLMSE